MSHEQNDQQAQMLRGTAWMTASNFISRLLGAAILFLGIFGWENMGHKPMVFLQWATISMLGFS